MTHSDPRLRQGANSESFNGGSKRTCYFQATLMDHGITLLQSCSNGLSQNLDYWTFCK